MRSEEITMKCPACGTKYKGKKCPGCGRHTDPKLEAKRNTRIALLVVILIFVAILLFYIFRSLEYYNGIVDMINNALNG